MSTFQVEAVVLHARDFSEKDVLLTLLTKERGKMTVICKGVKKPNSRMRAAALLFAHSRFFLYEGKSMAVATQAESIEHFAAVTNDLERFALAAYWAEMAAVLLPEHELNFLAYSLFIKGLRLLNTKFSWSLFFIFQVKLLTLAGFQPVAEQCVSCGEQLSDIKFLSPALGGTVCITCSETNKAVNEGTVQLLRLLKQARLEQVMDLQLSARVKAEIQTFLKAYIEYHTEHKMRSADFLKTVE